MNTEDFLAKILPTTGPYCLAVFWKGMGGQAQNRAYDTVASMAAAVRVIDTAHNNAQINIFHALASYKETFTDDKGRVKVRRTQANVAKLRSIWMDLDVGEGKAYDTPTAAVGDLRNFVKTASLPSPMVVSSGNGIHVYWPFEEEVEPSAWIKVATMLLTCAKHAGMKPDGPNTTDSARILRPVGSHHRKSEPKLVRLLKDNGPYKVLDIAKALKEYMKANALELVNKELTTATPPTKSKSGRFDMAPMEVEEYPSSSIHEVKKHCQVVRRLILDNGGDDQPLWWRFIGLAVRCDEGDNDAEVHALCENHPKYDYDDTQASIDQWKQGDFGAPKCESFQLAGADCEGCPQRGKISGPRRLGYTVTSGAGKVKAAYKPEDAPVGKPHQYPKGYSWNGESLVVSTTDEDGVVHHSPIADREFYVINRVQDDDHQWHIHIEVRGKRRNHRFLLPSKTLAKPQDMAAEFATNEVNISMSREGRNAIRDLLMAEQAKLRHFDIETRTMQHFGWQDEGGFVIGNQMYYADKAEEVLLGKMVPNTWKDISMRAGTVEQWVEAVDKIYNRPGAEAHQFIIATAFGSPLIQLMGFDGWHGIPISLVGEGGTGKSTICKVATSVFAKPSVMTIDAGKGGTTMNGLLGTIGAAHNIPVLFDEITKMEPRDMQGLLYTLSLGKQKVRLNPNGSFIEDGRSWDTVSYVTGNESIAEKVVEGVNQQVADATQVRVFELDFTNYPTEELFHDINFVTDIEEGLFKTSYGEVGREYIRHILKRRGAMIDVINRHAATSIRDIDALSKERFYRLLIATTIAGASIAKKLGFINFDINAIRDFATTAIRGMREVRSETQIPVEDAFNAFLTSLVSHTLVTDSMGDGRGASSVGVRLAPNRELKARIALDDKLFIVSHSAFTNWCIANGLPPIKTKELLTDRGLVQPRMRNTDRYILGKGTNIPSSQARCIWIDFDSTVQVNEDNAPTFKLLQGGKQ